jgi:RNA polymerase sigma-70 factor (ECF subfamily)
MRIPTASARVLLIHFGHVCVQKEGSLTCNLSPEISKLRQRFRVSAGITNWKMNVNMKSAAATLSSTTALMSGLPEAEPAPEVLEIATLIRRTISGDSSAFEQVIVRYERRVISLAMKLLGESDDARDAAQEVFLRAYKYAHRLDLRRPVEPWLMRMTVNVCRDIGRKRQLRRSTFLESENTEALAYGKSCNPHAEMVEEEERRMLRKALDALPERERVAIILRDIEGLSTTDVAAILESSESTVRSQVSRARVRLRNAIEQMIGGRS